ncbi:MAG TPA: hypothetical protein DC042_05290 [Bacteroidales bacterium]|nr:hypothetical protein [Bacteroidales bacterium]
MNIVPIVVVKMESGFMNPDTGTCGSGHPFSVGRVYLLNLSFGTTGRDEEPFEIIHDDQPVQSR